jgi:hypothetical protein
MKLIDLTRINIRSRNLPVGSGILTLLRAHDDGGGERYRDEDETDLGGRAAVTIGNGQDVAAKARRWNVPHHSLSGFAQRRCRRISVRFTIARPHKGPVVGNSFDQYVAATWSRP